MPRDSRVLATGPAASYLIILGPFKAAILHLSRTIVANEPCYQNPSTEEPCYQRPSTGDPCTKEPCYRCPSTKEPCYRCRSTEEPCYQNPSTREPCTEEPSIPAPGLNLEIFTNNETQHLGTSLMSREPRNCHESYGNHIQGSETSAETRTYC